MTNKGILANDLKFYFDLFEHLRDEHAEGVRLKVYNDPNGIPTVSTGVALGSKTDFAFCACTVTPKVSVNRNTSWYFTVLIDWSILILYKLKLEVLRLKWVE